MHSSPLFLPHMEMPFLCSQYQLLPHKSLMNPLQHLSWDLKCLYVYVFVCEQACLSDILVGKVTCLPWYLYKKPLTDIKTTCQFRRDLSNFPLHHERFFCFSCLNSSRHPSTPQSQRCTEVQDCCRVCGKCVSVGLICIAYTPFVIELLLKIQLLFSSSVLVCEQLFLTVKQVVFQWVALSQ